MIENHVEFIDDLAKVSDIRSTLSTTVETPSNCRLDCGHYEYLPRVGMRLTFCT